MCTPSNIRLTLQNVVLFEDLDEAELQTICDRVSHRKYALGELLFSTGDPRDELLIIQKGGVEIRQRSGEVRKTIARLGEGSFIGEGAMLNDEVHSNSARAVVDTQVLILTRDALDDILAGSRETAGKLLKKVAQTVAHRLRHAGVNGRPPAWPSPFSGKMRREHDLLGEREVPAGAYYGIQTMRALENYNISGIPISHFPQLINALAMVKKAAAKANKKLGDLDPDIADAVCLACDEIIAGHLHDQFVVDMIQGGAGTSTNMNTNEVIANRALEIRGFSPGEYRHIHPNNHVNQSQSTNDAYPTALRLAVVLSHGELTDALAGLAYELKQKAVAFSDVIKMGRTQLQDAVPMTLGQEFDAFCVTIKEDIKCIQGATRLFHEVNLGATAIGTGITARPEYAGLAVAELSRICGTDLVRAENLVEATSDMGAFVLFSSVLKRIAVKLSKMCNDLRLLSSGPYTGFNEINLPARAPGSSIMPGKVNPVIPEMVNQTAFQVIGNDLAVTLAAEAGQLQLNVMEPVIAFNCFQSLKILTQAVKSLTRLCIKGITANREICRGFVENSIGVVTALNPYIGYENATRIAQKALETDQSVMEIVQEEGLLTQAQLKEILSPLKMTGQGR